MYKLVIIAALLGACALALKGAGSTGKRIATLTGALGLGLFAVTEVFAFAYLTLLHGSELDITVANYSRNCAYLFFLAALLYLVPESAKGRKPLQVVASGLSALAIVFILMGVVLNNPELLYYSALLMMVLSVASAIYLIITGNRGVRLFAASVIAMSILDSIHRLLIIFDPGWYWHDITLLLYPVAYLFIGFALLTLREEATDNG